jgi:hypothetical protein
MSTASAKFTINGLTYVVTLENPPPPETPLPTPPPEKQLPKVTLPISDPDSEEMKQEILRATSYQNIYRITDGTKAHMRVVKTKIDQGEQLTLIFDNTNLILVNMVTGDIFECKVEEINSKIPSLNTRYYTTGAFSNHVNTKYYAFYPTRPEIHTGRNPYQGGGSRRKYGKSKRARSYKLARR